jgi:hypothetical protein
VQRGISYVAFVAHEEHHLGARILRKALGTLSSSPALSLPGRVGRNLSACFPGLPRERASPIPHWRCSDHGGTARCLPPLPLHPVTPYQVGPQPTQTQMSVFHRGHASRRFPPLTLKYIKIAKSLRKSCCPETEGKRERGQRRIRRRVRPASRCRPGKEAEFEERGERGKRGRRR